MTYAPDLIEKDCNSHKLKAQPQKISSEEKRILHVLETTKCFDYDEFSFSIENDVLFINDGMSKSKFSD